MTLQHKKLGIGSLSLLIIFLGLLFNLPTGPDHISFSHHLFHFMGVPVYSNGNQGLHYPFLAAAIFWVPAFWLARKHRSHYGTGLSYYLSGLMLAFCLIGPLILILDWFF